PSRSAAWNGATAMGGSTNVTTAVSSDVDAESAAAFDRISLVVAWGGGNATRQTSGMNQRRDIGVRNHLSAFRRAGRGPDGSPMRETCVGRLGITWRR